MEDSSALAGQGTLHAVKGLAANQMYWVRVNGVLGAGISGAQAGQVSSDATGAATFTYAGAYAGTSFELSLAIPGDANADGLVDQADYTVWYNHYGSSGALWTDGDFTGDGLVDQADYTIWFNHYGASGGGAAPAGAADIPAATETSAQLVMAASSVAESEVLVEAPVDGAADSPAASAAKIGPVGSTVQGPVPPPAMPARAKPFASASWESTDAGFDILKLTSPLDMLGLFGL